MSATDTAKAIEETLSEIQGRVTEVAKAQAEAATAELREELGKQHAELTKRCEAIEALAKSARGSIIDGVEVSKDGEPGKFSLWRLHQIAAHAMKGRDITGQKEYGYEAEYLSEMRKRVESGQVKSYSGGSDDTGGYFIGTDVMDPVVDLLTPMSVAYGAGAQRMDGMSGNIQWIKETSHPTVYWVDSEAEEQITESQGKFGVINSRPHPYAVRSKLTWGMVTQSSPSMEQQVRRQFARKMANAEDLAILEGVGNQSQPTGILNNSLVNQVTTSITALSDFGLNGTVSAGTAQTTIDYFREFIHALREDNALGLPGARMSWVLETGVHNDLERVVDNDGRPLFLGLNDQTLQRVMGAPVFSTTQIGGTVTAAQILFGDFSQCLVPHWGATNFRMVEEEDDASRLRMTAIMHSALDVVVAQPTAFAKATAYDRTGL